MFNKIVKFQNQTYDVTYDNGSWVVKRLEDGCRYYTCGYSLSIRNIKQILLNMNNINTIVEEYEAVNLWNGVWE